MSQALFTIGNRLTDPVDTLLRPLIVAGCALALILARSSFTF